MTLDRMQFGSIGGPLGAAGTMGQLPGQTFDFNSLLGPLSKGLGMFSGLMGGINEFGAAKSLTSDYRDLKRQAGQALQQGFQTGMDIEAEGRELTGAMTAAFGKQGTLMEGSPLLALADETREIEISRDRAIEQGRIQQAQLLRAARKAKKAAKGHGLAGALKIAGVVAAPFTGGASLALSGVSTDAWR